MILLRNSFNYIAKKRFCTSYYEDIEKKNIFNPFVIKNENLLLSFFPIQGLYERKNDILSFVKVGSIILEFIPKIEDSLERTEKKDLMDWNNKIFFALSIQDIGKILSISDRMINKKINISREMAYNSYNSISSKTSIEEQKILKIKKKFDEDFFLLNLIYKEIIVEKQTINKEIELSIKVTNSQFITIREFSKFLLPHLLGWNLMNESSEYERLNNE